MMRLPQSLSRFESAPCLLVVLLALGVSLGLCGPAAADGGSEAGVQEYLVPGTQAQMLGVFNRLLEDIYGEGQACVSDAHGNCLEADCDLAANIESRLSIVAYSDRSVVLLDDASNGYQGGFDPESYDDVYDLDRGQVITFAQDRTFERPGQGPGVSEFPLTGGDRLVTIGGPVLVMRAAWPKWVRFPTDGGFGVSVGQILAECLSLYPTAVWGREYGSPMGVPAEGDPLHVDDLTTLALVQAERNGTAVAVNGVPVGTLGRGRTLVIDSVPVGASITGSEPIAVALMTSGQKQVDVRAFNLTPPALLDSTYVVPANGMLQGDDRELALRLYLFAYEPLEYGVYQGGALIAGGALAAAQTAVHPVTGATEVPVAPWDFAPGPENSPALSGGLRVEATGRLQVLVAFDSARPDWDWGFPAVGGRHLTNEYFVPWAPGRGPGWPETNVGGYRGFGQPVFVSPLEDHTRILVDWDPWMGNGPEGQIDLDAGQWATLVDPIDGDSAGARLYAVRNGAISNQVVGPPDTGPEGAFAVAWGEDILADLGDGYDLGYGLLPQKEGSFDLPFLDLTKVVEPEEVSPGDEVYVTLTLRTDCEEEVERLRVVDTLPNGDFTYVPGSTSIYLPDGTVVSGAEADPETADGLTLAWDLVESLAPNSEVIVTFRVAVAEASEYSNPLPDTQVNNAEGYGEWCPFASRPCFDLRPTAFDNIRVSQRTGTIKVRKKVKWGGATPDEGQSFTICVRPEEGGTELCQEVDWDGGTLVFEDLPTGRYEVYEKDVDEADWMVKIEPETVEVHGRCGAAWAKVVNTYRWGNGTLEVKKVVDWQNVPPDPGVLFTVCIRGPSYPEPTLENLGCQQIGYEGGVLTWTRLQPGYYRVYEDPLPGPEWQVVGSGQRVWVDGGRRGLDRADGLQGGARTECHDSRAVIKNIRKRIWTGKVVVKKRVDWNGFEPEPVQFEICVVGPAPEATAQCQTIDGAGTLVFDGLLPGTYTVTEDPGPGWEVTILGSPVEISRRHRHCTAAVKVKNRRVEAGGGRLEVTKTVDWNGEAPQDVAFSLCAAGPSYPDAPGSCQTVSFAAGDFTNGTGQRTVTWPGLEPGGYTISETDPGAGWTVAIDPVTVAVAEGQTATGRVSNTRQRARLEVEKVVEWNGVTPPSPLPEFTLCVTPEPANGSDPDCQTTTGGVVSWPGLPAGGYTLTEPGVGSEWQVTGAPAPLLLEAGQTTTARITNAYRAGRVLVVKETVPPGDSTPFQFIASWDPDGFTLVDGQSEDSGPLAVNTSYLVSEVPTPGWTTTASCQRENDPTEFEPVDFVLGPGDRVTCTFTNAVQALGSIRVTKIVNWSGATAEDVSFEICIYDPGFNPSCQNVFLSADQTQAELVWEGLPEGEYLVGETPPDDGRWSVRVDPGLVNVVVGEEAVSTVTNTWDPGGQPFR